MPVRSAALVFGLLSAALAMGYGVLFTVVGDFRDEYGVSETAIGVLIGVGFLAAFAAQILVAPVADRGHARAVVVAGVVANVAGLVLMGLGESLTPILVGRVVSGIGIGATGPAIRRIIIVADPENLGSNLGRLISAEVFGFALGPAVSAVLVGPLGLAAPFYVVAALTGLLLPLALRVPVGEAAEAGESAQRQRLALDLLRQRIVGGAIALGAAVYLMIGAFDALWDVVHEDLDTPTWMANLGITFFAIPLVVLAPWGGRLAQQIGPFRISGAGLAIATVFMILYGQLPTGQAIFYVALIHAITDGLTITASGVALAMAVPEERQAGAQGLLGGAQSITAGVAAIVVGAVYENVGRAAAYLATGIGMVAMIIIGMALAAPFWRTRRHLADTAGEI